MRVYGKLDSLCCQNDKIVKKNLIKENNMEQMAGVKKQNAMDFILKLNVNLFDL